MKYLFLRKSDNGCKIWILKKNDFLFKFYIKTFRTYFLWIRWKIHKFPQIFQINQLKILNVYKISSNICKYPNICKKDNKYNAFFIF